MSGLAIRVDNLTGGYIPHVNILHGISLSVEAGEAVGVLGLNGSGKSSFAKALINTLPYRTGALSLFGEDVSSLSTEELANIGIRMMFQGGQVFRTLSAWDNLCLVIGKEIEMLMEKMSPLIPLLSRGEDWLKGTMADKLSGGERHQLALAMVLATSPKILILDEPSAGLSPKAVHEIYDLLERIREQGEISIILIEQNVSKAVGYCNRCVLMQQGQIACSFERGDLKAIEELMFSAQRR